MCLRVSSTAFSGRQHAAHEPVARRGHLAGAGSAGARSARGGARVAHGPAAPASSRRALSGRFAPSPSARYRTREGGLDRRVVGQPQAPGSRPAGTSSSRRCGGHGAGGPIDLEAARQQVVDRIRARRPARAPKSSLELARTPRSARGRRLKSPPSRSGAPPAQRDRGRGRAARLPLGLRARAGASGAGSPTHTSRSRSTQPHERHAPPLAQARAPGSGFSSSGRLAPTIRHGGRTSVRFEPPSQEPIRSGFQRPARCAADASQLRDVSAPYEARAGMPRASAVVPARRAPPGAGRRPSARREQRRRTRRAADRFTCTWVSLCSVVRSSTRAQRAQRAVRAGSRGRGRGSTTARAAPGVRTGSRRSGTSDLSRRRLVSRRARLPSGPPNRPPRIPP